MPSGTIAISRAARATRTAISPRLAISKRDILVILRQAQDDTGVISWSSFVLRQAQHDIAQDDTGRAKLGVFRLTGPRALDLLQPPPAGVRGRLVTLLGLRCRCAAARSRARLSRGSRRNRCRPRGGSAVSRRARPRAPP